MNAKQNWDKNLKFQNGVKCVTSETPFQVTVTCAFGGRVFLYRLRCVHLVCVCCSVDEVVHGGCEV